jgi:hypothetical protein
MCYYFYHNALEGNLLTESFYANDKFFAKRKSTFNSVVIYFFHTQNYDAKVRRTPFNVIAWISLRKRLESIASNLSNARVKNLLKWFNILFYHEPGIFIAGHILTKKVKMWRLLRSSLIRVLIFMVEMILWKLCVETYMKILW